MHRLLIVLTLVLCLPALAEATVGTNRGGGSSTPNMSDIVADVIGTGETPRWNGSTWEGFTAAAGSGDIGSVGSSCTTGDCFIDGEAWVDTGQGGTLFVIEGTSVDANEYRINLPNNNPASDITWTFPNATGTLVLQDDTATLTNKTINTASNTITIVEADISDLAHTTDTNLTQEEVEDFAGALVATGGTKTGITITYQDSTGDMDFVVDNLEDLAGTLDSGSGGTGQTSATEDAVLVGNTTAFVLAALANGVLNYNTTTDVFSAATLNELGASPTSELMDVLNDEGAAGTLLHGDGSWAAIVTGTITDDTIAEVDLDIVDGDVPGDEECLTYEASGTGGDLEWEACGTGSGATTDEGTTTRVTGATDDFAIGWDGTGTASTAAAFFFDESSGELKFNVAGSSITFTPQATTGQQMYLLEGSNNGANRITLQAPAAITTDQTCDLENDSSFIPDACVGDGSDQGLASTSETGLSTSDALIYDGANWVNDPTPAFVGSDITALNATQITSGTIPAARAGADHIDALTEIAQGIKTAANDTDPLAVFTGGNPGSNLCVEMNSSGQLVVAGDTCANLGPGGTTSWDSIANPAGNGAVAFAETVQTLDWNSAATAAGYDALSLTFTHDSTTDASTQRGLVVERLASSGTATFENLVRISNLDTDGAVTAGILLDAAAGLMTTAIDASDAEIGVALAIGSNTITTTSGTILAAELDLLTGRDNALVDTDDAVATAITGLGTVTAGTWNATAIGATYGGTGIDTSASTGVAQVSSGTWSVSGTLTQVSGGFIFAGSSGSTQVLNFDDVDTGDTSDAAMTLSTATQTWTWALDETAGGTSRTMLQMRGNGVGDYEIRLGGTATNYWMIDENLLLQPVGSADIDLPNGSVDFADLAAEAVGTDEIRDGGDTVTGGLLVAVDNDTPTQFEYLALDGSFSSDGDTYSQTQTKEVVLESPADADNFLLWKAPYALTISDIFCIVDPADTAESVVIDVQERNGTGDSPATVDATITCDNDGAEDDGTLTNGAIDSGDWISLDIGTVTGTVTQVAVTIHFTAD